MMMLMLMLMVETVTYKNLSHVSFWLQSLPISFDQFEESEGFEAFIEACESCRPACYFHSICAGIPAWATIPSIIDDNGGWMLWATQASSSGFEVDRICKIPWTTCGVDKGGPALWKKMAWSITGVANPRTGIPKKKTLLFPAGLGFLGGHDSLCLIHEIWNIKINIDDIDILYVYILLLYASFSFLTLCASPGVSGLHDMTVISTHRSITALRRNLLGWV